MDTKATFIYDYKSIDIPEQFLAPEMPNIEAVAEAECARLASKHSKIELVGGQHHVLTDEMVKEEKLPGIETADAYKEAIRRRVPGMILSDHTHMILMNYLVPQLVQRSTFEINDKEATEEGEKYLSDFKNLASERGKTVVEAGRERFGENLDEGEIRQYLLYLGRTHFLVRVLAGEYMRRQGRVFDLASYSGYVTDLAKMSGTPEEKIRELVPLNLYIDEVPGMMMLDEMADWLASKITFSPAKETGCEKSGNHSESAKDNE